jgi:osmotically-inducible protein OsmY
MRTDEEIKRDVEDELRWDPDISAADIAVSVKNNVVTLAGFVRSYGQKLRAEEDAKRVPGALALANDLEVRLPVINRRPDPDIARDAVAALRSELPYAVDEIRVIVKDGRVTLEGEVEWNYQRERAENALRRIRGVKNITNLIDVKPSASPAQIKLQIEQAFHRNAEIDANSITVESNDGVVVLQGTVRSWAEREEAERVAWSAPGVRQVDNRIEVIDVPKEAT